MRCVRIVVKSHHQSDDCHGSVLDNILRVQFILSCLSPNIEVHLDDDIRVTTKKTN